MTMASNPHEMLLKAADLIQERGAIHGQLENNFQLIADLFSMRVGRDFHPFEVCVLMECVKDARMFANPANIDNYLDGINYKAFAALFAQDYINSGAGTKPDIGYKVKANLPKAEMRPVEVSNKGNGSRPKHQSAELVNINALDSEIRAQS